MGIDLGYARDLVMTGVIFGVAALVWAGWAQERPPAGRRWPVTLGVMSAAGLVLVGVGVTSAIRLWNTPTALASGSVALVWYIAVFWAEVVACVVLAIVFRRTARMHLLAPAILVVVGIHFIPLAFVFGQVLMLVAAVLVTAAGVAAFLLPHAKAAPSFWCGILAAPIFVVCGAWALWAGLAA